MVTLRLMVKRKDRKRAGNYCPEIRRKILRSKDTIVTRAQRARAQNRRARRLAETAARARQAEEARGTTRESRTRGRGSPKQWREPDKRKGLAVLPARAGPEEEARRNSGESKTGRRGSRYYPREQDRRTRRTPQRKEDYPKIIYTGQQLVVLR